MGDKLKWAIKWTGYDGGRTGWIIEANVCIKGEWGVIIVCWECVQFHFWLANGDGHVMLTLDVVCSNISKWLVKRMAINKRGSSVIFRKLPRLLNIIVSQTIKVRLKWWVGWIGGGLTFYSDRYWNFNEMIGFVPQMMGGCGSLCHIYIYRVEGREFNLYFTFWNGNDFLSSSSLTYGGGK